MASLMGILKSWQNYDRHLHIIYIHIHIYSNGCNQWMNQWLDSRTKTRHNFFTWKFQGFLSLVVLIFIPRIASGWVSDFPIDHFFRWWCLLTISIFFDSVKPQLFMGKFPFFPSEFPHLLMLNPAGNRPHFSTSCNLPPRLGWGESIISNPQQIWASNTHLL